MEDEKDAGQNKRAKIIVASGDELTDILRRISSLNDSNILLTFAEESDLLISPINLKVLQEVCDELNKNLILQIIQNSNGVRNAKIAGAITTESPSEVDEALWLLAENQKRERRDDLEKALKGKPKEVKEAIQNLDQKKEPILQDSEYQQRVQEVIEKAKNFTNKDNSQVIQDEDLIFAIGQEIGAENENTEIRDKKNILVGKNFSNMGALKDIKSGEEEKGDRKKKKEDKKEKAPRDKKKIKKKVIIFTGIALASIIVAGVFAYTTLPLVKAEIPIESKAIEVEKVFKGNINVQNFSVSEGQIPIKREEIKVDRSDHANTTGEGKRGSKAEGIVLIVKRYDDEDTLPAGTKIVVNDLQFEITREVSLPEGEGTTGDIPIRAMEPGAEYNLSAGKLLSVEGYPKSGNNLDATNLSAFSGGSSEEYPMLTQADYNSLLERLKTEAFEEGKKKLEGSNHDWEMVETTMTQTVDGSPNSDIPISGEASMFNMSITTTTSALFFNKSEIIQAREEIIKRAAIENDLFKSDGDIGLELDPDIETEITIEEVDGNNVTITFKAKGNVRAKIDTEDIEKSLLGKSWKEGLDVLEKIKYSEEKTEIKFYPEYFPDFLKHFPKRQGRVIVETKLIETEVITELDEVEEAPEE